MPITHLNEGGVCFLVQIEKNDEDIKKGIDEDHFKQYLEQEEFKTIWEIFKSKRKEKDAF